MRVGIALVAWQSVEEVHFRLFCKLLGLKPSYMMSIVYFSTENFDARRILVGRMAQQFLKDEKFTAQNRSDWNEIDKDLKTANLNRNKFAHYTIEHDFIKTSDHPDKEGWFTIEFGPYRLRPSTYNKVSELLGRTHINPEHNLSPDAVDDYTRSFNALAQRVADFTFDLDSPYSGDIPPGSSLRGPRIQPVQPPPPLKLGPQEPEQDTP